MFMWPNEARWLKQQLNECQSEHIDTLQKFIDCYSLLVEYQKLGSIEYLKTLVKKDKENRNV